MNWVQTTDPYGMEVWIDMDSVRLMVDEGRTTKVFFGINEHVSVQSPPEELVAAARENRAASQSSGGLAADSGCKCPMCGWQIERRPLAPSQLTL